jgi:amino acid transporter
LAYALVAMGAATMGLAFIPNHPGTEYVIARWAFALLGVAACALVLSEIVARFVSRVRRLFSRASVKSA